MESPILCHNLVRRKFDSLVIPQDFTVVSYISVIMMTGTSEENSQVLITFLKTCARDWEINSQQIQGLLTWKSA